MKVSIICPTNRPSYIPHVTDMYHSQDYKNKELIVIQGDESIGYKRNLACKEAKGDIIIHFDDDDYYAKDYVSKCVEVIKSGADTTGLSSAYFANFINGRAWKYEYTGTMPYVIGSGMAYRKSIWVENQFKDTSDGEDRLFLSAAGRVVPHGYINGFLATIHGRNTCSQHTIPYMTEISMDYVKKNINFGLY